MIEYIVAKSSHTRRCAGVPLWSLTSYAVSQASWGSNTSSSEIVEGRTCGIAADGGAYGEGRTGVCEAMMSHTSHK